MSKLTAIIIGAVTLSPTVAWSETIIQGDSLKAYCIYAGKAYSEGSIVCLGKSYAMTCNKVVAPNTWPNWEPKDKFSFCEAQFPPAP